MKHLIAQTRNGLDVNVDLINSPAAGSIAQLPYLLGLIKELLQQTSPRGTQIRLERDMGRSIGFSYLVETTEKDSIVYARLLREESYTRFVKNGIPRHTKYLTVILERETDGSYNLVNTWLGRLTPSRPGTTNETADSKTYWANHAFAFGHHTIQTRTLTKVCPY